MFRITFTCHMTLRTTERAYTTTTTTMSTISNMRAAKDARFKTVHFGKDQRPVSIMKLASMMDHSWQRGASFNHFAKVIKNYYPADLVTVVANELVPISTESAFEEAENAGEKLRQEFFDIRNLDGSYFMTSKGMEEAAKNEKLQDRPRNLTYFTFLCIIDPKLADSIMTHASLAASFILRLPQSIYNKDSNKVIEKIEEHSVRKTRDDATGLDKLVGEDVLYSVQSNLFGGGSEGTYGEPPSPARPTDVGQTSTIKLPKMSHIIGPGIHILMDTTDPSRSETIKHPLMQSLARILAFCHLLPFKRV